MDGISRIIAKINTDAEAEITQRELSARERETVIRTEFAELERNTYGDAIKLGAEAAVERFERLKDTANQAAEQRILDEKQALLDETFSLAEKRLTDLPDAQYIELLAAIAAKSAQTGAEKLIFNEADKAQCGDKIVKSANAKLALRDIRAELTLADETRDISGGVIISGYGIEIDTSLEVLISQRQNELSLIIAPSLFELNR